MNSARSPSLVTPCPPHTSGLASECLQGSRALETLANDCLHLWHRCPNATLFQSPAWLLAWWRQFGTGEPAVLTVRTQDELVGLLPAYFPMTASSAQPQLIFLGTGTSDYLDALVNPAHAASVIRCFSHWLEANAAGTSGCDFQSMPPDSLLLSHLLPESLTRRVTEQDSCPILSLPARPADLGQHVPAHQLGNLWGAQDSPTYRLQLAASNA